MASDAAPNKRARKGEGGEKETSPGRPTSRSNFGELVAATEFAPHEVGLHRQTFFRHDMVFVDHCISRTLAKWRLLGDRDGPVRARDVRRLHEELRRLWRFDLPASAPRAPTPDFDFEQQRLVAEAGDRAFAVFAAQAFGLADHLTYVSFVAHAVADRARRPDAAAAAGELSRVLRRDFELHGALDERLGVAGAALVAAEQDIARCMSLHTTASRWLARARSGHRARGTDLRTANVRTARATLVANAERAAALLAAGSDSEAELEDLCYRALLGRLELFAPLISEFARPRVGPMHALVQASEAIVAALATHKHVVTPSDELHRIVTRFRPTV